MILLKTIGKIRKLTTVRILPFHEDRICNKRDLPARETPLEHGVSEQLSQATQNCHDNSTTIENQNAWQLPRNPVQSINHNLGWHWKERKKRKKEKSLCPKCYTVIEKTTLLV